MSTAPANRVPFGDPSYFLLRRTIEGKGLRMVPKRDDPGGIPALTLLGAIYRHGRQGRVSGFRRKFRARLARLGGWNPESHFPERMVFSWRLPWMRRGNIKLNSDTNQSHSAWGFL